MENKMSDKTETQGKNSNYFIYKIKNSKKCRVLGEDFVEENETNGYLIVNGEKTNGLEEYANLKEGENKIEIIFTEEITNYSNMFASCYDLVDISPLKNWNVSNVTIFDGMFFNCHNLEDITSLKDWDVSNSTGFSSMFFNCNKLKDLSPLKNWNVSKSEYFQEMFSEKP